MHFCVIPALHKKFSQSLRDSPENPFDWKFLKIGSIIVHSFITHFPNLQVSRHTLAPPTALTIKGVYAVSKSWYG